MHPEKYNEFFGSDETNLNSRDFEQSNAFFCIHCKLLHALYLY
jgi:hypothetical protein